MNFANIKRAIIADKSVTTTFCWCTLPWVLTLLFFSSQKVLLHFVAMFIILTGLGNLVLKGTQAQFSHEYQLLFSPSLGFVVAGSVITLGVTHGISPCLLFWIIAGIGLTSSAFFIKDMLPCLKDRVPMAFAYMFLSAIVCGVYFVPVVLRDAIVTNTGGYHWIYVDTQYFTALAACVKMAIGFVRMPGSWELQLNYHFAPYAISGAMSAATGIELGDAVVRVMRGIAQVALLLSATGLSIVLGRTSGRGTLAGLFGSFGLFFYGSLTSLFARCYNSSSTISGALFFDIPNIYVESYGSLFDHIILGHSVLNGMIGLTAVLGVLLIRIEKSQKSLLGPDVFFLIPGLLVSINAVAGLGAGGIVASVIIIFGFKQYKAWLSTILTLVMVAVVFIDMGFHDSEQSALMYISFQFLRGWYSFFIWTFLGLGFRIYGFSWIKKLNKPEGWVVLISTLGFCLFSLLVKDLHWGNERYGLCFLQALMSLFAFSALAIHVEGMENRSSSFSLSFMSSISYIYIILGLIFLFPLVLEGFRIISNIQKISGKSLYLVIIVCLSAVFGSLLIIGPLKKSIIACKILMAAIAIVYSLGFFAWITPWVNYNLMRMGMDIEISSGELVGLKRLRSLSDQGDLFATNHHSIKSIISRQERSYSYMALSERPAFLEGWQYGECLEPLFQTIKDQNDLIFKTNDQLIVKSIIERYLIKYIVTKPGTDINLLPIPKWLELEPNTGSLKIYRVKWPLSIGMNSH